MQDALEANRKRTDVTANLLGVPLFRALWIAALASNIGSWMQEVGATWLMTSLSASPLVVSLVQAATSLPLFLLALPAGALADLVDRRKLLLGAQAWMLVVSAVLGVLTYEDAIQPWSLVLLTFSMGLGTALTSPAWQAAVPEMVGRDLLPDAVAANAVGFNLARAVGPAIGGFVVAAGGPEATFFLNAVSFLAVLWVLYRWKRPDRETALPAERFLGAMRAGLRYVRYAPSLRRVIYRTLGFTLGGSCLWALLPLLARRELNAGPGGYGVLLGCFGVGAVSAGLLMPRLRKLMSTETMFRAATVLYAVTLLVLAYLRTYPAACGVMFLGGAAWLSLLSNMNVAAQNAIAPWVRARGLAIYLLSFFASFAFGSVLWGFVASEYGYTASLVSAAMLLLAGIPLLGRFRVPSGEGFNAAPSRRWPAPTLAVEPDLDRGPILITVEYRIDPARAEEFKTVMHQMHIIRRRDGAIRWGLWNDAAEPERYVESFVTESWAEHLRQHERMTHDDLEAQAAARAFHLGEAPPVVHHMLYAYE